MFSSVSPDYEANLKEELFGCHPCENTSSLRFKTSDLTDKILPALGYSPAIVHLVGAD